MAICGDELCERLQSEDDAVVLAALHDHFEPRRHPAPLSYQWCLRSDVELESEPASRAEPDSPLGMVGRRLLGLANEVQRTLRARRFRRQRQDNPHWPVVVAEGDSWMAHPLVDDITDHLLDDDRYPYAVLGLGAASDRLAQMEAQRDHERAMVEHGARALLLSGGGNDLLVCFGQLLRLWRPGSDPWRLIDDTVDVRMHDLMKTMRVLLTRARSRMPSLPILVHGYDYLRVAEHDRGGFLGPLFDEAGIDDFDERQAVLRAIVDRYNEHVQGVIEGLPDVTYLDLRGVVPDPEWDDEIHPNGDGFSRIGTLFGEWLRDQLDRR